MSPISQATMDPATPIEPWLTEPADAWRPADLSAAALLGLVSEPDHAGHASADCRSCHRGDLRTAAPTRLAFGPGEVARMADQPLSPGMAREAVRLTLGEPKAVEQDGVRWVYEGLVVIFRQDQVAGWVNADAGALAMNERAAREAAASAREPQFAGRFANLGPAPTPAARKSSSDSARRFDVLSRLRASRSAPNATFRQPEWMRSLSRSLDRNHEENRRREARLANSRRD